jgi:hypothetical protein
MQNDQSYQEVQMYYAQITQYVVLSQQQFVQSGIQGFTAATSPRSISI